MCMDPTVADFFMTAFFAVLVIVNPFSTIGVFLTMTKSLGAAERHRIVLLSTITALCVLLIFSISGFWIFQLYSITIDAFRTAGGIALFAIGFRMLFGEARGVPARKGAHSTIYLFPLAIPLTSGPGAITTVVVLASNVQSFMHEAALWAAIAAAMVANYAVLVFSERIEKILGSEGLTVLTKLMGLMVCSTAVQFIATGLKALFPVLSIG